ncbi:MAG: hypothetical protein BZ138_07480, partial [Methanosphaera sp. rholeuAM270]
MNYKILLFLCILLLTSTAICATEENTQIDVADSQEITGSNAKIIKEDKNYEQVKANQATSISLDNQQGECYYGGRLSYNLQSNDNTPVDMGCVDLYVNDTFIASKMVDGEDYFDWMYMEDNELSVLDQYPTGQYPIKVRYTYNSNSIDSNTATLTINPATASIYPGKISTIDGKIILQVSVVSSFTDEKITSGTIRAISGNTVITSINCTEEDTVLVIPVLYQQKTVQVTYTDNGLFFMDASEDVFLDVVVAGNGTVTTQITVNNMQLVNITSIVDDEQVIDRLGIEVCVDVTADKQKVTCGTLRAYHDNKLVASSSNASSIIIPAEYNLEELTLNYTGVGDYNDSYLAFTLMVDKIATKSYISYISTTINTMANIYPSITSNYPFLYGKLNVYIDNNLVKTIN